VLPVLPEAAEIRSALTAADDAGPLVAALTPGLAEALLPDLLALAARGVAVIPVLRRLGTLPAGAGLVAAAMRSPDDLTRTNAAASWLLAGHPPAPAIITLREVMATGSLPPAWWLEQVARAGPAALPLLDLVTPRVGDRDHWTAVRAAEALARQLGRPGTEVLPAHLVAICALERTAVLPAAARDRVREFAGSPRRLLRSGWPAPVPYPDDLLRDAARRLLVTAGDDPGAAAIASGR
jgi:hypothetical protein